jgi:hypothetical protein
MAILLLEVKTANELTHDTEGIERNKKSRLTNAALENPWIYTGIIIMDLSYPLLDSKLPAVACNGIIKDR